MSEAAGRPWVAEREVPPALARRLLDQQFPPLRGASLRPFGAGWDNTAYLVDEAWVFRFPRRRMAVPFMEAELRNLPRLAGRLPVPVPVPQWIGRPSPDFPWSFGGYRLLPGVPAYRTPLGAAHRQRLGVGLAAFLRALHDVDASDLALPGDTLDRAGLARRKPRVAARLVRLADAGLLPEAAPWVRALEELGTPAPGTRRVPVHGDLDPRHLLLDEGGELSGVIDWGDLHRGDPAVDLAGALGLLPRAERRDFFRVYGEVAPTTLGLARLRGLHSAACCLEYAHDIGDEAMTAYTQRALVHLLE